MNNMKIIPPTVAPIATPAAPPGVLTGDSCFEFEEDGNSVTVEVGKSVELELVGVGAAGSHRVST